MKTKTIGAIVAIFLILLTLAFAVLISTFSFPVSSPEQCQALVESHGEAEGERQVWVFKTERVLCVSEAGKILFDAPISYGRGKGHKQFEGDLRTPEGDYRLNPARPSTRFGQFMLISYPNENDRKTAQERGQSPGGDVGIHGPHWSYEWLGVFQAAFNHSEGCIVLDRENMGRFAPLVPQSTRLRILPFESSP